MALDKLVDSTQLDTELTSIANAIREKTNENTILSFPNDFINAITNITSSSGAIEITENGTYDVTQYAEANVNVAGGEKKIVLLASGTYVKSDGITNSCKIPVSFTGTPCQLSVVVPEPIEGASQAIGWFKQLQIESPVNLDFTGHVGAGYYQDSTGSKGYLLSPDRINLTNNNTVLSLNVLNTARICRDNTYNWYIWGYAE